MISMSENTQASVLIFYWGEGSEYFEVGLGICCCHGYPQCTRASNSSNIICVGAEAGLSVFTPVCSSLSFTSSFSSAPWRRPLSTFMTLPSSRHTACSLFLASFIVMGTGKCSLLVWSSFGLRWASGLGSAQ